MWRIATHFPYLGIYWIWNCIHNPIYPNSKVFRCFLFESYQESQRLLYTIWLVATGTLLSTLFFYTFWGKRTMLSAAYCWLSTRRCCESHPVVKERVYKTTFCHRGLESRVLFVNSWFSFLQVLAKVSPTLHRITKKCALRLIDLAKALAWCFVYCFVDQFSHILTS